MHFIVNDLFCIVSYEIFSLKTLSFNADGTCEDLEEGNSKSSI